MTSRHRLVFDTNVLISTVLARRGGACRAFTEGNRIGVFLASGETLAELEAVLYRSKFDRYISRRDRDHFLRDFLGKSIPTPVSESFGACTDPDDNKFLDLAIAGKADYLVTGNLKDFPESPFRGVQILSPAAFFDAVSA